MLSPPLAGGRYQHSRASRANNLYEHALFAVAVELGVEDLPPGAEVELAARDGDAHFAPHHLPLQVRIRVVLASAIVAVLARGCVRGKTLEPNLVVVMQPRLVVVDEH